GLNFGQPWTPEEHEIVKSCTVAEAHARLPYRTPAAIKSVRRDRQVGKPQVRWTKAEDSPLKNSRLDRARDCAAARAATTRSRWRRHRRPRSVHQRTSQIDHGFS